MTLFLKIRASLSNKLAPAPNSLQPAALQEATGQETCGPLRNVSNLGAQRALPTLLAAVVFLLCHQFKGQLLESYTS